MSKPRPKIRGFNKSCADKQKFDTLEAAEAAAHRGRNDFMQAYKCKRKACGKFHYGHPKGWRH